MQEMFSVLLNEVKMVSLILLDLNQPLRVTSWRVRKMRRLRSFLMRFTGYKNCIVPNLLERVRLGTELSCSQSISWSSYSEQLAQKSPNSGRSSVCIDSFLRFWTSTTLKIDSVVSYSSFIIFPDAKTACISANFYSLSFDTSPFWMYLLNILSLSSSKVQTRNDDCLFLDYSCSLSYILFAVLGYISSPWALQKSSTKCLFLRLKELCPPNIPVCSYLIGSFGKASERRLVALDTKESS